MTILTLIYILVIIIFSLVAYAVLQLRFAGIKVKDFWSFIEANQLLDKLYNFSRRYKQITTQEQIIFLMEAEKVFEAFDKIPTVLWEEEFRKYTEVLNMYKEIKVLRWQQA